MTRSSWAMLVLVGCGQVVGDTETSVGGDVTFVVADVPDEAAAPGTLEVVLPALVAGETVNIGVRGAYPGETIALGRGSGLGAGPCGAIIGGQCLGIVGPAKRLPDIVTNGSGAGFLSVTVPDRVGRSGCFQAVAIRGGADAELSDPVCGTIVETAPVASVLLTDSGTDTIYRLGLDGSVLNSWASPVSGLQGVALDRRERDGFWVAGTGALGTFYKVDFSGAVVDTMVGQTTVRDIRGLDYVMDDGGDLIAAMGVNVNSIDVLWGFREDTGQRWIESGHYDGGFLNGLWGVHVIAMPLGFDRWVTRQTTDTLDQFVNETHTAVLSIAPTEARGMAELPDGSFLVVDQATARVVHLAADGSTLGAFATPGNRPSGISYLD